MRRLRVAALMACLAMLVGCGQPSGSGGQPPSNASIQANPNPVPAGADLGATTIVWKTGDGSQGQVYVSEDGGGENLFDSGTDGSKEAPWIRTGSTYEFRLYAGSAHKSQLGSVRVSRAA